MLTKNDKVVWFQYSKKGKSITMKKCTGTVAAVVGQIATVIRDGNHHKVDVQLSSLTKKADDGALSLVRHARQVFNI